MYIYIYISTSSFSTFFYPILFQFFFLFRPNIKETASLSVCSTQTPILFRLQNIRWIVELNLAKCTTRFVGWHMKLAQMLLAVQYTTCVYSGGTLCDSIFPAGAKVIAKLSCIYEYTLWYVWRHIYIYTYYIDENSIRSSTLTMMTLWHEYRSVWCSLRRINAHPVQYAYFRIINSDSSMTIAR